MATFSAEEGTLRTAAREALLTNIIDMAPNATAEGLHHLAEAYASVVSPSRGTLRVETTSS
ncbi:MAG: hypothetical protein JWP11_2933 [Frankiales bacterium]|nr:hypothetical protein [Frankiales bacterium]